MSQQVAARENVEHWDQVFEALSAEPRRQLVVALMAADPGDSVALPDAAINPALDVDRERMRTHLYHRHLPALADGGFVDWDRDAMTARRGPNFDRVAVVFSALFSSVNRLPDELVEGCPGLEEERSEASEHD